MATYGNGTILPIKFRATIKLGDTVHDLGDFDSEEDAQNAIEIAEAEWERDLQDAASPPKTIKCHDCDGSGTFKGEECNMCLGNGWIAE
ncbi:hypothetical protein [Xanthomonas arboricola]|uniref:hypothetical protein n=1 Tax=Xanthomonas arboricola TaxID=56448 RepID=UPI0011B08F89|nr:hypothetical protein [Xanthomonas arboricola]